MAKSPLKRMNAVFYDLAELPPHGNDLIKKLADAINNAHDRLDALNVAQPSPVTPSAPVQVTAEKPPEASPFKQRWFFINTLTNDDVRDVYVDRDLRLIRFGQHGVRISDVDQSPVPAVFGTCVAHNYAPLSSNGTLPTFNALRIEIQLNGHGVVRGTVFTFGTTTAKADRFTLEAYSDDTVFDAAKWCLNIQNQNIAYFPSPSLDVPHIIILEFDGTSNIPTGKNQWKGSVDGVPIMFTNAPGGNNNVTTLNDALILSMGGMYADPVTGTPTLPFPGVISELRVGRALTGNVTEPPAYNQYTWNLWVDAYHFVNSEYVENGRANLTQTHIGPALSPSSTGVITPWLFRLTSSVTALPQAAQIGESLSCPLIGRVYGFPPAGGFTINGANTGLGATVDWIVATPNVWRLLNLAYPDEQKWSLFHCPFPADTTIATVPPVRTLGNVVRPEAIP